MKFFYYVFSNLLVFLTKTQCAESDCYAEFQSNEDKVFSTPPSIGPDESFVCGVSEISSETNISETSRPEAFTRHNLNQKRGVFSDCTDSNNLLIPNAPKQFEYVEWNNVITRYYTVIGCISKFPLRVQYNGTMPLVKSFVTSTYSPNVNQYESKVYIPLRTESSGMYSFYKRNSEKSEQMWFLHLKISDTKWNRLLWSDNGASSINNSQVYIDPDNYTQIIIPCSIKYYVNPSEVSLHFGNVNASKWSGGITPEIGFVMTSKDFNEYKRASSDESHVFCKHSSGSVLRYTTTNKYYTETQTVDQSFLNIQMNSSGTNLLCKLTSIKQYIMTNMFLSTLDEFPFLRACLYTEEGCKWNSDWKQDGDGPVSNKRVPNFKRQLCPSGLCELANPFISGVLKCSEEYELYSKTDVYFTGLNNEFVFLGHWKSQGRPADSVIHISNPSSNAEESRLMCNESLQLVCSGVHFLLLPRFMWTIAYRNGTKVSLTGKPIGKPFWTRIPHIYKETLDIELERNNNLEVKCCGHSRDNGNCVEASFTISCLKKEAPSIFSCDVKYDSKNELSVGPYKIVCKIHGLPTPKITWTLNETVLPSDWDIFQTVNDSDNMVLSHVTLSNGSEALPEGYYTCKAENSEGYTAKTMFLNASNSSTVNEGNGDEKNGSSLGPILGGSLLGVTLIGMSVFLGIYAWKSNRKCALTNKDITEFLHGSTSRYNKKINYNSYECLSYNAKSDLDENEFTIDDDLILGTGYFGPVYRATLRGTMVAVKTARHRAERNLLLAFLGEIKTMSNLEEHSHVLSYAGAYTKQLYLGKIFLFVEFCDCGTLETFLKEIRSSLHSGIFTDDLLAEMMKNWILQTADGMEFLSSKKIIHGDLSVRSLLLKDVDNIKISGFGFRKQMDKHSLNKSAKSQLLPWRVMAPETLLNSQFSEKSDVWGFGVTVWEIYSLAETPQAAQEWTEEFLSSIESGLRLEKPVRCPQELFDITMNCWNFRKEERPDFKDLNASLNSYSGHVSNEMPTLV